MLYFYSAVAYTEKGEIRAFDVKEIKDMIADKDSFWIEIINIQEEICTKLKEQYGPEFEIYDIMFTAFNPI